MKKKKGEMLVSLLIILLLGLTAVSCTAKKQETKTASDKSAAGKESGKTTSQKFKTEDFEDPDSCGFCHTENYNAWKGSIHNVAWIDPVFQKVYAMAVKDTGEIAGDFCARCHNPIGVMTGEIPPYDGSNVTEKTAKGISCDFCHTVQKYSQLKNGGFINNPDPVKRLKRGPFDDSESPWHSTEYSKLHTQAEFCGMCHNVTHPVNDLPLENTFTEWKEGPYAKDGIICQDCHMTPGPGVTKPNPGTAVNNGKQREHIWTHFFVGGSSLIPIVAGDSTMHAGMAVERLQSAAGITILPPASLAAGENKLDVKVENKGCGHYLPTGLTEVRQCWLYVLVKDAAGKVVYESGALDPEGNIKEGAVIFNTHLGDKNGKETEKVWEAEKILSDHRIPPKESLTESFKFTPPAGAAKPLKVEVTLKYRSASQGLIDDLFGKNQVKVPVVDMVRAETVIN